MNLKNLPLSFILFVCFVFFFISSVSAATAGDRDNSFATGNGVGTGANSQVNAIVKQSDNKLLVGGGFSLFNGYSRNSLARLNADGSLDTSFMNGMSGANSVINAIVVQSDGKIIVVGNFTSFNGVAKNRIARLNSDGSLDADFLSDGDGANNVLTSLALQTDGKILVGGGFSTYNDINRGYIVRLNADGSLDTDFLNTGAGANQYVYSIYVQPDGQILIGGAFTTYNLTNRGYIARLNTDGSLDGSFLATGVGADGMVRGITRQTDGQILINGDFSLYNSTIRRRVARINTDGSLDTNFLVGGNGADGPVYELALQADDKIVIGGTFSQYAGTTRTYLARLNTNGSLDATPVYSTTTGINGYIYALAIDQDQKILAGGVFQTASGGIFRNRISRLNTDGTPDTTFGVTPLGLSGQVYTSALQSNGKLIVAGDFISYNGEPRGRIARLNTDGSLDTSFTTSSGGANGIIRSVALQTNGKILIAGDFTAYNGVSRGYVARLNADGSLDTDFLNTGAGAQAVVYSVVLQNDHQIVIGGNFTAYNGTTRGRLARLNTDGSLDSSFLNTGAGADGIVETVAIQPDQQILIGGGFTKYNGTNRGRIARVNTTGTLDTSFVTSGGGANSSVSTILVLSDRKIMIGGWFSSYNGTSRGFVARLTDTGALDTSFLNTGAGANSIVSTIVEQSDGKILIGGNFSTYNTIARGYIARLATNGALDTFFLNSESGATGLIKTIKILPNNSIVAGGTISIYNGQGANHLVAIYDRNAQTIQNVTAANVQPLLANPESWGTDLKTIAQSGSKLVGVADAQNGNRRIAELNVSFEGAAPSWSGVTAGTGANSAFFHAPQGILSISSGATLTYTLYVPKGTGISVLICPGATSLAAVELGCTDGYQLTNEQTLNGATATVVTEDGISFWKVEGLTGTGGKSMTAELKDIMTRMQTATASDHTISFATTYGITYGESFSIIMPAGFIFPVGFDFTDTGLAGRTVAASSAVNTWGMLLTGNTLTMSAPTSGTGTYAVGEYLELQIGLVAGGTRQISNPATANSYEINIEVANSEPSGLETGAVSVAIVDSDQVDVTSYINTFISFDIDTAVTDSDCAYDDCLIHQNGLAGTNYTVDLGELNSAYVNTSNGPAVMHTQGGSGIINSIWFDLTTNAINGAVLYVSSANGDLRGPDSNAIASVPNAAPSSATTITANSGRYGYNIGAIGSEFGTIVRNSNCSDLSYYCALQTTQLPVFDTANAPIVNARVRMDIAAAATYLNNPGLYSDTLTFVVVPTF